MAKRTSGLKPLWKKSDINKLFKKLGERAEWQINQTLQLTGEEFVKAARLSGNYEDRSGNLRSSIGYVIVRNGHILGRNFVLADKGTDKQTGKREGEQLAMDLVKTFNTGYVLIGVAGMKYAVFVEAMENFDVLTNAANKAEAIIKQQGELLFKRLEV